MAGSRSFEEITEALRAHLESGIGHRHRGAPVVLEPPDPGSPAHNGIGRTAQGLAAAPTPRLGLHLYQVTPDAVQAQGPESARWTLRYLLTPHAAEELTVHRLLSSALRVLFERPVLDARGHALHIGARHLDEDGMRALWSAFGAPYRLSVAFEVRGVDLANPGSAHHAGPAGHGVPRQGPVLLGASPPGGRPAAQLGDLVELQGRRLCGPAVARLEHRLVADPVEVPTQIVASGTRDETTVLRFALPHLPTEVPAGVWLVSLSCPEQALISNDVALAVAPRITTSLPVTVRRDRADTAVVRLGCEPVVRPGQPTFLVLGNLVVPAEPNAADHRDVLEFRLLHARPRSYPARLRVDGVDGLDAGAAQSIIVT